MIGIIGYALNKSCVRALEQKTIKGLLMGLIERYSAVKEDCSFKTDKASCK